MRLSFCFVFVFIFTASYSLEKADSSQAKLKASATFSLNSNGISSVPAFSLGDPAAMVAVVLAKKRFSYEPTLAYGLDGRPWFIDNWFRYKLVNRRAFELRIGMNVSSYFSEYKLPDETILQGQRYFAYEIAGVYKFSPNTSLSLSYWNDNGQEKGTLKGHFVDLIGERNNIPIGKHVLLGVNLQLFYINYDGNNDGLFVSPRVSSTVRNVPVSVYFQAIQALVSNISPFPEFQWNIGMAYTL
jgi:hypothetical protein